MTRFRAVLIASAFAVASVNGEARTDSKTLQALYPLVMQAETPTELRARLPECCPGIKTEHDVLNVLFGAVREGTANEDTWNAVHRIRELDEGAWAREYAAAAYEALRAVPRAYYDRYLKGDGDATELLGDAFDSARNQIETGPGCTLTWSETAAQCEKVLGAALASIQSAPPPTQTSLLARHTELLGKAKALHGEWQKYLETHKTKCAGQGKQAR